MKLFELDANSRAPRRVSIHVHSKTFGELVASLEDAFPDAKMGRPRAVANTGEDYVEFYASGIARPDDIEFVKRNVLGDFARALLQYLNSRDGNIYWRIKPEEDLRDAKLVICYSDDGPDIDFYTGRPCFMDPNWKRYSVYCRLLRSGKPELSE